MNDETVIKIVFGRDKLFAHLSMVSDENMTMDELELAAARLLPFIREQAESYTDIKTSAMYASGRNAPLAHAFLVDPPNWPRDYIDLLACRAQLVASEILMDPKIVTAALQEDEEVWEEAIYG